MNKCKNGLEHKLKTEYNVTWYTECMEWFPSDFERFIEE